MIFLYTGLNGSGKTFLMVWHVFNEWIRGRAVYSNTHLFFKLDSAGWMGKAYRRVRGWTGIGEIHYFHEIYEIIHVRNACIIFDEGQTLFYSRYFDKLPAEFVHKITQQRKHGLDLYCTTPDAMMIDVNYFRLIHEWYFCETVFAFPREGKKLLQVSRIDRKDTTKAKRKMEQKAVPVIDSKYLYMGTLTGKPVLYDTNYDVGFDRFKTTFVDDICQNQKGNVQAKTKCWILPKNMSISEASRLLRSYKFTSSRKTSAVFRRE